MGRPCEQLVFVGFCFLFCHLEFLWDWHAVKCIHSRDLIGFGQRRLVKGVFDEIIHGPLQVHHRLSDMDQFGRAFAHDLHTQNAAGF